MSVELALEESVLVVGIDGEISADDVVAITRRLVDGAGQRNGTLAVLAIFRSRPRLQGKAAKRVMRANRDAIRGAVAEVHVVLGTALGLVLGTALQLLRSKAQASIHRNEAEARRALRAAGFGP